MNYRGTNRNRQKKIVAAESLSFAESVKNGGLSKAALTLTGLAGALAAIRMGKPWDRVAEGHVALREKYDAVSKDRHGQIKPKLVESGLRYKAPFKGVLKAVDVRKQDTNLEPIDVYRDNELWVVKSSIFWRVMPYADPVYRALYKASGSDDLGQIISTICTDGLRQIYENLRSEDLTNSKLVDTMLYNRHSEELHEYGVELEDVKIRSVAPDRAQILKSGMMQMPQSMHPGTLAVVTEEGTALGIVA
jgi:regulator of protease activity HflC (stomatin/prohibitin superfamily)